MLVTARNPHVLVWAGVELIFFAVSALGLCLEFVLGNRADNSGDVFISAGQGLSRVKAFSASTPSCGSAQGSSHSQDSCSQPIQVTFQTDPGDIPDL